MVLPHDDCGAGPALVLLHAGIADRTMWADHLGPIAAAGHRVIAPDLGPVTALALVSTPPQQGTPSVALRAAWDAEEAALERGDLDAIGRLALPTVVAAGEHDLPDFRGASLDLAQRLPQARHAVIADAGHLAPLEQPEAFRAVVLG